jgi:hypothetical protein
MAGPEEAVKSSYQSGRLRQMLMLGTTLCPASSQSGK